MIFIVSIHLSFFFADDWQKDLKLSEIQEVRDQDIMNGIGIGIGCL